MISYHLTNLIILLCLIRLGIWFFLNIYFTVLNIRIIPNFILKINDQCFIFRMYSLKSFVIVALICTSLRVSCQNADSQQARLLVSKQVLNKLLVQDSDILVKVCLHNLFY